MLTLFLSAFSGYSLLKKKLAFAEHNLHLQFFIALLITVSFDQSENFPLKLFDLINNISTL